MRKLFVSAILILAACQHGFAQTPTLGSYPATTIAMASGNTTVTPSATPTNATRITTYISTSFKGQLQADPATGVLTITNAHPAGTYTITIKALNGTASITTTCRLTVNNTLCSQNLFSGTAQIPVSSLPSSIAIADFNRDGKQDFVTTNAATDNISIRFGNGVGGFAGNTTLAAGDQPTDVAVADVNGDGFQDIAVTNFLSKTVSVRLGNGTGVFSDTTNTSVPGFPQSVIIADFNEDGKPDFATANNATNTVSVRLGNGAGSFSGTTEISVANNPIEIVAADFNEDGKPDFATANANSTLTSVRLGDGTGNFIATADLVSYPASSLAIGDFNGDGHQDVAIASLQGSNIYIRIGTGTGYFTSVPDVVLPSYPSAFAIGDFNGDGNQDIAAVSSFTSTLAIRSGTGTGSFIGTGMIPLNPTSTKISVGNFNGDGRQDLALGSGNNVVAIRLGDVNEINVQGNGVFIADGDATPTVADSTDFGNAGSITRNYTIQNLGAVNLSISAITLSGTNASQFQRAGIVLPATIAAGAAATFTITFTPTSAGLKTATINILNDDCDEGVYDFAIQGTGVVPTPGMYTDTITMATGADTSITPNANPTNTSGITAWSNGGLKGLLQVNPATGKLTITNAYPAGTYLVTVKAFNGVLSNTTSFYIRVISPPCSQGIFTGMVNTGVGDGPAYIAIGDFNNDGKQDFATANFGSDDVSVRLGNGAGGFNTVANLIVRDGPTSLAVSDFNLDGNQDLVIAHGYSNNVAIRLGNGLGGFIERPDYNLNTTQSDVVAGDFNGDGKPDFATINAVADNVIIGWGDGVGGFAAGPMVPVGYRPSSIAAADFNNDGKLDFATTNSSANTVSIRVQNATGGFSVLPEVTVGTNPVSIEISDFNGDGKQDLAVANYAGNISIRMGDGFGYFTGTGSVSGSSSPVSVISGDFNGDGKPDLANASGASSNLSIRFGDGAGNFSGQDFVNLAGNQAGHLATGDFNGDGKLDIAAACVGTDLVTIGLGNANEISVKGNNTQITDGDSIPAIANYTDFGTLIPGASLLRTFTIQNTGTGTLTITNIRLSGADSAAFVRSGISLPTNVAPDSSKTFTVTFSSTSIGIKSARVNIINNDCDESLFDFAINGTASCGTIGPDNTWLGTSANWNTAANWSLGFVPVPCTKVVINAGVPFMPEISSPNTFCYSLTLNNGATVTVKSAGQLNITANH